MMSGLKVLDCGRQVLAVAVRGIIRILLVHQLGRLHLEPAILDPYDRNRGFTKSYNSRKPLSKV